MDQRCLTVAQGSTVLDAIESYSPRLARALASGTGTVTDGVGRTLDLQSRVPAGAIIRTVAADPRDREDG